ncbi:uncharacterized protein N0V89_012273 [Didymosphaeria variabile]|uniref:gamma-glutamylcyclotransferase n=1 Tax=Didymosphaeria variabile TaxID=1932322 RepID=A0A9W8XAA6_9PLEO|nr:uncharacterized protein N0V89_012273 [Didymosphaeria variabile]KAJ4344530.1 hypothetical protein N0V89_012273 [Didymosphaeria variabile]
MTSRYRYQHPDRTADTSQNPTNVDEASQCWVTRMSAYLNVPGRGNEMNSVYPRVSETSQARRDASLTEPSFDAKALSPSDFETAREKGKTVLYLAYGSNLCKETFRGKRGIKPLSQINVLVPSLRLTFDLPGIPYIEPCFGNSAMRDSDAMDKADYHKDRWQKGLVGCVYEVTPSDYAHIIATEGGGAGYQDILVDCYPLTSGDTVPEKPTTQRFVAHTLFAPAANARPDPSYAQPSARYLNLITTGAAELCLPHEYQHYLHEIRTYTITSKRQKMGKVLFASIWWPFLQLLFALNAQFQDDKGRSPPWLAQLAGLLFLGMWRSYDGAFKKAFGNGERTEGDEMSKEREGKINEEEWRRIGEENGWLRRERKIEDMA